MTCSARTKCDFVCTAGNCKTVICKADTCEEVCTGGGCGLECHGKNCEQICTGGNCKLQCPSDAKKCQQWCTVNRDKCTIEDLKNSTTEATTTKAPTTEAPTTAAPSIPNECNEVRDGVCSQYCVRGGCMMECFNSTRYHSCEQICTGNITLRKRAWACG